MIASQAESNPSKHNHRYLLSPLAEFLVQRCVPTWVAPNLITLLGLLFPLASLGVFAWTCPGLRGEPPAWAFFFHAFALFAYQTLDNMDGKQVCGAMGLVVVELGACRP